MDIKIDDSTTKFKFRVGGILKFNDKYLAVMMNNNNFYCFPGGHVELGEDTETAVLREMREELGYEVEISKLLAINENFFKENQLAYHEIGFYYLVSAKNEKDIVKEDYEREELDKGKIQHLKFKWFSLEEIQKEDFKPNFLIDALKSEKLAIKITKE